MSSDTTQVYAQDHVFVLADADADPAIETLDFSTGLAGLGESAALICTGIDSGFVHVTVQALPSRPPLDTDAAWTQLADWEDVAEFSLHAPRGHLTVERLSTPPAAARPDLAPLSSAGPGDYRIRIHARGRDQQYDQTVDDSTETFLIVAWPETTAPPVLVKAASRCGYGLRLTAHHPTAPQPPHPPPADQTEADHQAALRRALLDQ